VETCPKPQAQEVQPAPALGSGLNENILSLDVVGAVQAIGY